VIEIIIAIALLCQVHPNGMGDENSQIVDAYQLKCQQGYLDCIGSYKTALDRKLQECIQHKK
jgi:hypothetical protein